MDNGKTELFVKVNVWGADVKFSASEPKFCVVGVNVGAPPSLVRLKRLYSRSFSCGFMGVAGHSDGNGLLPGEVGGFSTWYSLKRIRPHWLVEPTGALKVNC